MKLYHQSFVATKVMSLALNGVKLGAPTDVVSAPHDHDVDEVGRMQYGKNHNFTKTTIVSRDSRLQWNVRSGLRSPHIDIIRSS